MPQSLVPSPRLGFVQSAPGIATAPPLPGRVVALPSISTPLFGTKKGMAGLRLHATDLDHTVVGKGGESGPIVEGPADDHVESMAFEVSLH